MGEPGDKANKELYQNIQNDKDTFNPFGVPDVGKKDFSRKQAKRMWKEEKSAKKIEYLEGENFAKKVEMNNNATKMLSHRQKDMKKYKNKISYRGESNDKDQKTNVEEQEMQALENVYGHLVRENQTIEIAADNNSEITQQSSERDSINLTQEQRIQGLKEEFAKLTLPYEKAGYYIGHVDTASIEFLEYKKWKKDTTLLSKLSKIAMQNITVHDVKHLISKTSNVGDQKSPYKGFYALGRHNMDTFISYQPNS